ncbi:CoaE-domain-containing protein, partial [Ceraceosorus guamensis]
VVGLTGGIASGKSTVSRLLQGSQIPVIDLDVLAREVVRPEDASGTLSKLVNAFGHSILQPSGELDRAALGRIAFPDEKKRKILNKITHTAIRKRMAWLLVKHWLTGSKRVVVDTPLLIEAGLWKFCGQILLVWCSPSDQLSRLLSRDGPSGLTQSDAESRLKAQHALSSKLPYADVVLDNSSALQGSSAEEQTGSTLGANAASPALQEQVQALVKSWQKQQSTLLGSVSWLASWIIPPVGVLAGVWAIFR